MSVFSADLSPPVSFLFVAHEFYYEDGYNDEDCWGLKCPPTDPREYGELFKSRVMRYTDGTVTLAVDYDWERRQSNNCGYIFKKFVDGTKREATWYQTASVFACGPSLPVVAVECDASAENTFRSEDLRDGGRRAWSLLHFWHPGADPSEVNDVGTSRAMTRYGHPTGVLSPESVKAWVAGGSGNQAGVGDPSWLGKLVPWFFRHPGPREDSGEVVNVPPSKGLGGMLTVLIGLMALAGCSRRINGKDMVTPVFVPENGERGLWDGHRWYGDCFRGNLLHHSDAPRGFLVQVFLDDIDNIQGSNRTTLACLEWCQVLVKE